MAEATTQLVEWSDTVITAAKNKAAKLVALCLPPLATHLLRYSLLEASRHHFASQEPICCALPVYTQMHAQVCSPCHASPPHLPIDYFLLSEDSHRALMGRAP